jgi:hypothetical protein
MNRPHIPYRIDINRKMFYPSSIDPCSIPKMKRAIRESPLQKLKNIFTKEEARAASFFKT